MHDGTTGRGAQRGFTLVELLFTMAIIFLIMGLLLGGIRHLMKHVKGTADLATVNAIKQGVTQFGQTLGFDPPMVTDVGPGPAYGGGPLIVVGGESRPQIYTVAANAAFLRAAAPGGATPVADVRFSIYTIPYYVMGALDQPRSIANTTPIDGLAGLGMRTPRRDGTFEISGRTFLPFFDPKGHAEMLVDASSPPGQGRIEMRDSHGIAIRYYHWLGGNASGQVATLWDLNTPWILGYSPKDKDPSTPLLIQVKEELRNADYAIVAAGPDGLFGDEFLLGDLNINHPQAMTRAAFDIKLGGKAPVDDVDRAVRAMADNIVVVGVEPHR